MVVIYDNCYVLAHCKLCSLFYSVLLYVMLCVFCLRCGLERFPHAQGFELPVGFVEDE
jgi:hypothetical protein